MCVIDISPKTSFSSIAAYAYSNALYGRGTGSILLDDVRCTGTESRLIDCSYDSHTADCSHSEDAAVYCSLCKLVFSHKSVIIIVFVFSN